jgi:hypothetical protein
VFYDGGEGDFRAHPVAYTGLSLASFLGTDKYGSQISKESRFGAEETTISVVMAPTSCLGLKEGAASVSSFTLFNVIEGFYGESGASIQRLGTVPRNIAAFHTGGRNVECGAHFKL